MINKSDLHAMLQCPRKLWLEKNRPDAEGPKDLGAERRKEEGRAVGDLARKQLGPDILWPLTDAEKPVAAREAVAMLAANPSKPAVEVPLFFNDLYTRADALIPEGDGYLLVETKASSFPLKKDKVTPDKPDAEHIVDLAIQAWTMEQSGIPLKRAELNLLNSQWTYPGDGDYSGMFRRMNVTEAVRDTARHVPIWAKEAADILVGGLPNAVTGEQCSKPYSCQFADFCKKLDPPKPAHPIELLPDSSGKRLAKTLKITKGYDSVLDPKPEELTGSNALLYRRIQKAHATGKAIFEAGGASVLEELPYPRYYFDFEGIDLAIPRWKGVRPYEQIPFQWSCHIERSPGIFELGEFLDMTGEDPSLRCIEQLLKVIDLADGGPIFVYFATYEKSRLKELAKRHPQYANQLEVYISRLFDLLPVVKESYYHPKMQGSFSIKKVLPQIAPDLDYAELAEIQDGTDAQLAYIKAALTQGLTRAELMETEMNARHYCRQDTWAMVEVAYFLAQKGRPRRPAGI